MAIRRLQSLVIPIIISVLLICIFGGLTYTLSKHPMFISPEATILNNNTKYVLLEYNMHRQLVNTYYFDDMPIVHDGGYTIKRISPTHGFGYRSAVSVNKSDLLTINEWNKLNEIKNTPSN